MAQMITVISQSTRLAFRIRGTMNSKAKHTKPRYHLLTATDRPDETVFITARIHPYFNSLQRNSRLAASLILGI